MRKKFPRSYLSQYLKTARCDNIYDLSKERNKYNEFFCKEGFSTKTGESTIYKKILTYEELTPKEQFYLQDAVEYYSYLNQRFIVKASKPSFKLYYHAILKYERFPGVVPFLYGVEGSAATKRIHNRIKNRILEP